MSSAAFERKTRHLRIPAEGHAFAERARPALALLDEANDVARQAAPTETGVLRVTTPVPLAVRYLAPVIAAFRERHPRQCFDLQLSDHVVDLHGGDIDLADSRRILVEPPDDLRKAGAPSHPRELHQHPCLLFAHSGLRLNRWTLKHSGRGGRNEVMDAMGICAATMAMLCGHGT